MSLSSVRPHVRNDALSRSALPVGVSAQCLDQAGISDAVAYGESQDVVRNQNCDGQRCDAECNAPDDVLTHRFLKSELHELSSCYVCSDAKRFCSPPPVSATAKHDGSAVAGEGEGTKKNDAAWRSIADFLSLQFLRQEMAKRAANAPADAGEARQQAQAGALSVTLPSGNHGEIFSTGRNS